VHETTESLIAYCRENNRVCPMPQRWNALWQMLHKAGSEHGRPSAPLILAAWHDTPAMFKMIRLAEHIEWADKFGDIEQVSAFLRGLPEEDWFHLGE
jgi:hypothetical protein